MKIIKIYIVILALFSLQINSQWLADRFSDTDPIEQDPIPRIQFLNQNTGWFSSPTNRGTVYKTTDGGLNWIGYTTLDTNKLSSVLFIDFNTGWAVGKRGKIVKTTTGGLSWFQQSSGVQSWLNDVSFANTSTGIIVGSYDSSRVILRTTNGGSNWQQIYSTSASRLYAIKMINTLNAYTVGDSGSILYTSNGGINWVNQPSNVNSTLRDIVIKSTSILFCCVVGKNGVILTSTNGGINWTNRSFNNINFYAADFGSTDTGYVGGQFGRIYKTTNAGINWFTQQTPTDTTKNIKDIFCITNQIVWAHSFGDKLFYTQNGGGPVGIQPISSEVPTGFSLEQNFPNPFNPITKIQFSVPKSSFIKLTIYDLTGRVMAILVNEQLKPGTYEIEWDASHRASGVYYYKLEADGFAETKKMVLLK